MAPRLTEKDVRDIATYVRIGLDDQEVAQMTTDLNNIIDSLKPITEYDLEGVEPTFHPIGSLVNVMREDEPGECFSEEKVFANAPAVQDHAFLIPAILGGGDA